MRTVGGFTHAMLCMTFFPRVCVRVCVLSADGVTALSLSVALFAVVEGRMGGLCIPEVLMHTVNMTTG